MIKEIMKPVFCYLGGILIGYFGIGGLFFPSSFVPLVDRILGLIGLIMICIYVYLSKEYLYGKRES
jgi:hypothetical protein